MRQDATTIGAATPEEGLVTPGSLRDVVSVLERYRTGMDQAAVAAALGWDKTRVSKILSRVGSQFDIELTDRDKDDPSRLAPPVEEFLQNARQVVESYNALVRPKKFGVRKVRVGAYPK